MHTFLEYITGQRMSETAKLWGQFAFGMTGLTAMLIYSYFRWWA